MNHTCYDNVIYVFMSRVTFGKDCIKGKLSSFLQLLVGTQSQKLKIKNKNFLYQNFSVFSKCPVTYVTPSL